MKPYNYKVWAIPPVHMQCEWLGEKAAVVDVKQSVRSVLRGRKAPAPKAYFRFPQVCPDAILFTSLHLNLFVSLSLCMLLLFFKIFY